MSAGDAPCQGSALDPQAFLEKGLTQKLIALRAFCFAAWYEH